jgi:hypothetical protein
VQRPVMNPTFVHEGPAPRRRWWHRLRPVWRVIGWCLKLFVRDLFYKRQALRIDVGTRSSRFLRGLCYRLLFVPLIIALIACALVYTGTHPPAVASIIDPTYHGIYYDPVSLVAEDGAPLEAWMIPVVDAHRVLEDREMVFTKTHPAIILVHDFGASRQQMMPLVRPLHEAGYFVLVLGLRGTMPDSRFGSTFGLNEAGDVKAAAALLRKTPFVDGKHVGVLGVGTGATAAMLAVARDPELAALVLDCPTRSFESVLHEHVTPSHPYLQWLAPLCQWTFEIAYKVNATDVDLDHNVSRLNSGSVLLFDGKSVSCFRAARIQQVVAFLDANLKPKETKDK